RTASSCPENSWSSPDKPEPGGLIFRFASATVRRRLAKPPVWEHDARPPTLLTKEPQMRIHLACCIATLSSAAAIAAPQTRCDRLVAAFGDRLADATCFESTDLTTTNPA